MEETGPMASFAAIALALVAAAAHPPILWPILLGYAVLIALDARGRR